MQHNTVAMWGEKMEENVIIWDDYPVNPYGRKIDWWTSPEGLDLIAEWRSSGCTIKEIYSKMGVDARTFRTWRKKCPRLDEIMSVGKEIATSRVINALYRRAVGYDYEESVKELIDGEMVTTRVYVKHMPPDVKAILSYLYNRESQDWRAIQQPVDVNVSALQNVEDVLVKIRRVAETEDNDREYVSEATEGTSDEACDD